jgi:hypothetical protein
MTVAADGGAAPGGGVAQALSGPGALRQRGRPAIRIHPRDRAAGVSQLPNSARASTNGAAR